MNVILKKWQQSRWIEMPPLHEGELLRANLQAKKGLAMGMRLAVLEDQAAAVLAEGRLVSVFLPGAYQLEEGKMPQLKPDPKYDWRFPAEVFFLNLRPFADQHWQPLAPLLVRDPQLGLFQLEVAGSYTAQIDNATLFMQHMVVERGHKTWKPIHKWLCSRLSELSISLAARHHIDIERLDRLRERAALSLTTDINLELRGLGLTIRGIKLERLALAANAKQSAASPEAAAYNQALKQAILKGH